MDGDSGSWIVSQTTYKLCGYVFAKVDEFELAYMLPIEPVFNDISEEFSKKTKCSVDVPDGATIRRMEDTMEDKYIEELGQAPEPPARSPPAPPASLTNRERLGGPDDSLERLPKVNSNSLAFEFYQSGFSASKATGPSSDHVQPAFSVRSEEMAVEPDSPGAPAQKSPEMQQIGSPFGGYPPPFSPPFSPPFYLDSPVATNQTIPPWASGNAYEASMMAIKPAPAKFPSSGHIGSLHPPSRKAPEVPQVEHESGFSRHRKPSITKGFWRMVRLDWLSTIFATSLALVIVLGSLAASGYLILFIVRKTHFSTVAKVFSILGAVSIVPVLVYTTLYIHRRRNRAQSKFEIKQVVVNNAEYTTQNEAISSFNDDSGFRIRDSELEGAEVSEMGGRELELGGYVGFDDLGSRPADLP